jgi:glycosyltransferase involved in cell wall biosynthesis
MKRILFVQPVVAPPGGGEGLGAWMIEALKRDYRLTLLTWQPVDFEDVNRYFGTELRASEFEMWTTTWAARLAKLSPTPVIRLRQLYLQMRARRQAERFDAVIWSANEGDLGLGGIQYIHYPEALMKARSRWYHSFGAVRGYEAIGDRLTGFSLDRMKRSLTLANSEFTARAIREVYGIEPLVVYPPAIGKFPDVPWEQRKDGFVCIGRIQPEKKIERIIEILAAVRAAGTQVHLHVVGKGDSPGYLASIRRLVQANASWVHLHEDISRLDLVDLVANHRYGIHAMRNEPFGMAVAELVTGGCVTFVHNSGGQVEIVGNDERLIYTSCEDAVEKILRAIREPDYQASLRSYVASRRNLFGSERFVSRIRQVMNDYFGAPPDRNARAPSLASSPQTGDEPRGRGP